MGDHFETIDPDRPDTHNAYGVEDAKSFHDINGSADKAGGGGMGGVGIDDMIGVGGAGSRGSGGGFGGGDGGGVGVGQGPGCGSFGSRSGGGRRLMVKRHGGSPATEDAVNKALEWLAYHQEPDGHWDVKRIGGQKYDTSMTALALLAFLGAGHTERVGAWKDNAAAPSHFSNRSSSPMGVFSDKAEATREGNELGYTAAMATLALSEAAGMAGIKDTREAAQKAVNYCTEIHQQGEGSEKGAWRYGPKTAPDLSVTTWFLMAIKSAKVAGLCTSIPRRFEGASKFLDTVQIKNAGPDAGYGPASRYSYFPNWLVNPYRNTAMGALCRQFLGTPKEELQSTVELFVKDGDTPHWIDKGGKNDNPGFNASGGIDMYYWYYGTLACFQQGGEVWKKWNTDMKIALLANQCKNGDDAGSFDPLGPLGIYWGRVGSTALCALSLEVYYRYQKLNQ